MSYFEDIGFRDGPSLDGFSRLRVSSPTTIFESTFVYDLQPLIYEQTAVTGATITHSATNSAAQLTTTTTSGSSAIMQSYRHIRYQPGKTQFFLGTFCFGATTTNNAKRFGLYDSLLDSGFYLERSGTAVSLVRRSTTTVGNTSVAQASWNIDTMGAGALNPSGITLDLTKAQILVMDFQYLGVGRVRIGFDIDGVIYYVHQFLHANSVTVPYVKTLNLPVYARNVNTGTAGAGTTMTFFCVGVSSESGVESSYGYTFAVEQSVTAASGARTAILGLRPRTTFNSVTNRAIIGLLNVQLLNTGTFPVYWELCIGNTFSVAPTWTNVNATYSAVEYTSTVGTLSGVGIVIASGYINNATGSGSGALSLDLSTIYPITLNAIGAVRDLGTLSMVVTGIGGVAATRVAMNWKEIR